eukprot:9177453-Alexandrium_andersonii.AAC.1
MPPRHFGRRPAPSRSRSPHPAPAERGDGCGQSGPRGRPWFRRAPNEARAVVQADRAAFRA